MSHTLWSVILPQIEQKSTLSLNSIKQLEKLVKSSLEKSSNEKTNLSAVFYPIPGNFSIIVIKLLIELGYINYIIPAKPLPYLESFFSLSSSTFLEASL